MMENNENQNQEFTPQDGGYTQAPTNQGNVPQAPQEESKGFAIAGMVLGIVSIVCCCSPYIGGITGLLGLIFSILVLAQKRPGKGMAIAGVICAALGLVLAVSMFFANQSFMEYIQQNGGMESLLRDIQNGEDFY